MCMMGLGEEKPFKGIVSFNRKDSKIAAVFQGRVSLDTEPGSFPIFRFLMHNHIIISALAQSQNEGLSRNELFTDRDAIL